MSALALIAYILQLGATLAGAVSIPRLARLRSHWVCAVLALGCVGLAVLTYRLSDPPYHFWDFHAAYYPAGMAVLHSARQLRDLTGMGVSGFVNLPLVAYIFAPFAPLPERMAMHLFLLMGLLASIASWYALVRAERLGTSDRWLLLFLFAANGPLAYGLKIGNTSDFILLILAMALLSLKTARPVAAGALLGIAAAIKPPLLLFGPFFLLRRDWHGLSGFVAACGAIAMSSLILFGWDDNLHWFNACIVQFSHNWLVAYNVQSIPGFLFRLITPASLLQDWDPHVPPSNLAVPANVIFILLLAAAGTVLWRRARAPVDPQQPRKPELFGLELQYSLVICLTLLSSPLSWSHYYCWLLVPVASFLKWRHHLSRDLRVLGWAAVALTTPPVRFLSFTTPWLLAAYKNVGVSHLLFGGLLWFGLILLWLARPLPRAHKP